MGLADEIESALAESIIDFPDAKRALVDGEDIDINASEFLAFLYRRQMALEQAVLEIARRFDETTD